MTRGSQSVATLLASAATPPSFTIADGQEEVTSDTAGLAGGNGLLLHHAPHHQGQHGEVRRRSPHPRKMPPLNSCARPLRRLLRIKFDPRVNARVLFKEEKIKKKA